jgi:UrcA family protein
MKSKIQTLNGAFLACSAAMWLSCVLVASSAFAGDQLPSATVRFQDLNVSTVAGTAALYSRIHSAAKSVCLQPGDVWVPMRGSACVKDAEARAIEKLNLPLLTAYYRTKTGGRAEPFTANR